MLPVTNFGDALYGWYEELEDALWTTLPDQNVLSWWMRASVPVSALQWLTTGYPVLAPYYPASAVNGLMDPTAPYMGYWWP
ncbi:hypothetical protein AAC03nite_16670 [Alicyclobacillus acidoterrestris]|uniref:hypothetical protein n=1 Tax=Alicyclobacillus suci TaxID=2816080 RepID=UPI001197AF9E|nr:hypothetical protein [Alicyclobacillus suci]GEO25882.1 hypothetical protein AAC03nite_16670 [Alicyclobacillus acidoterrestris]